MITNNDKKEKFYFYDVVNKKYYFVKKDELFLYHYTSTHKVSRNISETVQVQNEYGIQLLAGHKNNVEIFENRDEMLFHGWCEELYQVSLIKSYGYYQKREYKEPIYDEEDYMQNISYFMIEMKYKSNKYIEIKELDAMYKDGSLRYYIVIDQEIPKYMLNETIKIKPKKQIVLNNINVETLFKKTFFPSIIVNDKLVDKISGCIDLNNFYISGKYKEFFDI